MDLELLKFFQYFVHDKIKFLDTSTMPFHDLSKVKLNYPINYRVAIYGFSLCTYKISEQFPFCQSSYFCALACGNSKCIYTPSCFRFFLIISYVSTDSPLGRTPKIFIPSS